ncbi:hypothetical protein [Thauera sp. 2A1]|uniref:hypothetical protein n=1 Tax=Thauera sp. 2A1 TaxID=2570191 RepID=UPI0012918B55|nr:hypothetical protein [Thauera sp. 2A1]KAI5916441.1 hypothetical protein GH664_03095 [Thauera sp. 2A1]
MIDVTGRPMVVARDGGLAVELEAEERMAQLAVVAAVDAFAGVLPAEDGRRIPLRLFLALPEADRVSSLWRSSRLSKAVEDALADRAEVVAVQCFTLGHVAGIGAVHAAQRAISEGFVGCCLILGVDSWLDPVSLEWLDEKGLLHSSARLFGFVPGEAAAGLLIGSPQMVGRTMPSAVLQGGNLSAEENLLPETPRLGLALTKVARNALRSLDDGDGFAEAVFTDLNGLPERADEVGYTMVRVNERLRSGGRMITPAEWFGDVGAATVPLMAALAVAAAEKGYSPERITLLLIQSLGAERGALLISLWNGGTASCR